jgi:4-amino-4-deoxy-L-arabinose transferase-like glycosyltransferase
MENVAGILGALALLIGAGRKPASWRILAFWLVMAITSLTKGLLGFALPFLIVGLQATFSSESEDGVRSTIARLFHRNRWLFHRMTPLAVLLAVAVYFAPFLLAADRAILDRGMYMVFRENLQRFFNPVNHKGPIYLYAYVIFGLFAPWSALLPAALLHRPKTESNPARTFALVFFWGTFLFFTLAASRRSYYLLPILPAASILVARFLAACSPRLTATFGGFAILAIGGFYLVVQPTMESYRWQRPFAEQVRTAIGNDMDGIALFHTRELVYYLNSAQDLTEFDSDQLLRQAVEAGRVRWLLANERDLAKLRLPMTVVAQAPIHRWDKGFENGGRTVLARYEGGGR